MLVRGGRLHRWCGILGKVRQRGLLKLGRVPVVGDVVAKVGGSGRWWLEVSREKGSWGG